MLRRGGAIGPVIERDLSEFIDLSNQGRYMGVSEAQRYSLLIETTYFRLLPLRAVWHANHPGARLPPEELDVHDVLHGYLRGERHAWLSKRLTPP